METNDWDPERVSIELRSYAAAPLADGGATTALAARALFVLGRGHAEIEPEFAAFYPRLADRVGVDARRQLFERIREHARTGLLAGGALTQFLRLEPERSIVAEAAFDVARLGVTAPGRSSSGADYVLELVVGGAVANPGAALGGLLALAADPVNAKLRLLRPALALPEAAGALAEMARCARPHVHVATVEFWLEWMESLLPGLPSAQRVFDRAAEALIAQRQAVRGAVVFDGSWIAPSSRESDHDPVGAHELPLARFASALSPRLAALAAAAPQSTSLRGALAAWVLVH
jgi:hypothetical protein